MSKLAWPHILTQTMAGLVGWHEHMCCAFQGCFAEARVLCFACLQALLGNEGPCLLDVAHSSLCGTDKSQGAISRHGLASCHGLSSLVRFDMWIV